MGLRRVEREAAIKGIGRPPALVGRVILQDRHGGEHELHLSSVISILAGRNGAGKTTILRALHGFLGGALPQGHGPFSGAVLEGQHRGLLWKSSSSHPEPPPFDFFYIDAVGETVQLLRRIEADPQPHDWLDGIDPAPFTAEMVKRAGYILGRDYEEIYAYEVTSFNEDDEPDPYYMARVHGVEYGSAAMGRGELAVLHLLWRLEHTPDHSFALIEEPESNLAEYSQGRIIEVLAQFAKLRNQQYAISSHYTRAFEMLPPAAIDVAINTVQVLPSLSIERGAGGRSRLGGGSTADQHPLLQVFLEDSVAASLLEFIVNQHIPELSGRMHIWKLGSESEVERFARACKPLRPRSAGIVFVLDGDRRGATSQELERLTLLPGNYGPEETLKHALLTHPIYSDVVNPFDLRASLECNEGLEIHDWFESCSKALGSHFEVWRQGWPSLCQSSQFNSQVQNFVQDVKSALAI